MNWADREIYEDEMGGGEYSKLEEEGKGVGVGEGWKEVKEM